MSNYNYKNEEHAMEAEALTAIFDTAFQERHPPSTQPSSSAHPEDPIWSILLRPVDTGFHVQDERDKLFNHVVIQLQVTLPPTYPDTDIPQLDIHLIRGLAEEHRETLLQLAQEEAQKNRGMPVIYTVCESLKNWLMDHNEKGLDDISMHAQMRRKQLEASHPSKSKDPSSQPKVYFESHRVQDEISVTELEELAVRKRREQGTPCTDDTFREWKRKFDLEMASLPMRMKKMTSFSSHTTEKDKDKEKEKDDSDARPTGYEIFSSKMGILNLDALERAAEQVLLEEEGKQLDVDEELFDDDEDLDDLDYEEDDFNEEDEEEMDDDDEEVDI